MTPQIIYSITLRKVLFVHWMSRTENSCCRVSHLNDTNTSCPKANRQLLMHRRRALSILLCVSCCCLELLMACSLQELRVIGSDISTPAFHRRDAGKHTTGARVVLLIQSHLRIKSPDGVVIILAIAGGAGGGRLNTELDQSVIGTRWWRWWVTVCFSATHCHAACRLDPAVISIFHTNKLEL